MQSSFDPVQASSPESPAFGKTSPEAGIKVTSPAPRSIWEEILQGDPDALVFQTPAWTDALCATGQYTDVSRLYEAPDGRRWVLPLVRQNAPHPSLAMQASMPDGWGMGGSLSASPLRFSETHATLANLAGSRGMRTTIRPNPLLAKAWEVGKLPGLHGSRRVTHILDLEGGFDQVWTQRLSSATRTKLRKVEKSGLEVEQDTTGRLVPIFYAIYMQWIERRARERHLPAWLARWSGKRREPLVKFQLAAQNLGEACQVWVVRQAEQAISAAFLLIYGRHAFYWRSASLKELATPTRANDLLQLRMIQAACDAGCRYYHMGESGGVASLMHFKSRFGAVETPYTVFSFERLPITRSAGQIPSLMKAVERRMFREAE